MSADSWVDCPRCKEKANLEFSARVKRLETGYGKMPEEDYLKLRSRVSAGTLVVSETLREDYELGVYQGEFYVSYTASCNVKDCGFGHTFEHKEKVE